MSQVSARPIEIVDDRGNVLHRLDADSLSGAHLANIYLRRAQLAGADLRGANLRDTDLREANLIGADLRGASFEGSNLEGAWLEKANLSGVHFPNGMNFKNAFMMEVDLCGAWLPCCYFCDAHLERADLSDARIGSCDFTLAHLQQANFRNANLINCKLQSAFLEGADLAAASITGAQFGDGSWFDLDCEASFDRTTKWPPGTFLPLRAVGFFGHSTVSVVTGIAALLLIAFGLLCFFWRPMLALVVAPVAFATLVLIRLIRVVYCGYVYDDGFNFDESYASLNPCRPTDAGASAPTTDARVL
jgi:hypothetical protein